MSSFRSSKNSTKDESSQWSHRLGLLSGRRSGKRRSPVESCVSGDTTPSLLGEPATRERRTLGLRHLASDSHLSHQYSAPSLSPSYNSRSRAPSLSSDAHSYRSNGMAGILDMDRSRSRRDRTFIGSQCAVCEEPLEHTLRGERVLQFSCGHVSHEACFYEYIKEVDAQYCPECNSPLGLDSSRGGNVLDLGMSQPCARLSIIVVDVTRETQQHREIGFCCRPQRQRDAPRARQRRPRARPRRQRNHIHNSV
jgi:hypothetical protein